MTTLDKVLCVLAVFTAGFMAGAVTVVEYHELPLPDQFRPRWWQYVLVTVMVTHNVARLFRDTNKESK